MFQTFPTFFVFYIIFKLKKSPERKILAFGLTVQFASSRLHYINPALVTCSFETSGILLVPIFDLWLHLLVLLYDKDVFWDVQAPSLTNVGLNLKKNVEAATNWI